MNALLSRVADLDPGYVKHHRRQQWTLGLSVGAAIVSLIVAVVVLSGSTQTPCQENPAGTACQQTKTESDRHQSVKDACVRTLKTGYPCPKPGSRVAREHPGLGRNGGGVLREPPSEPIASTGGGVASTPSPGHSEPAPPSGGATGHGGNSGGESPGPGSTNPPVPAPTEQPSATPEPTPPASEFATPEHPIRSTVEGVGSTVQETGKATGEAVGGLTCAAASLLHPCH